MKLMALNLKIITADHNMKNIPNRVNKEQQANIAKVWGLNIREKLDLKFIQHIFLFI